MNHSAIAGWETFFAAAAGAAATLSGLVFVAVSISIRRILASPSLPARAAETLMILMAVLVVALCGLVPNQNVRLLGVEIGLTGLVILGVASRRHLDAYRHPNLELPARRWLWARVIAAQTATVPFVIAGVLLMTGRESGMPWVVPGTVGSFIAGAFNAWVLLVEIQRDEPTRSRGVPTSSDGGSGEP